MSNLAQQIVVPIRPDLQVVEQRVADTDDGYTRLANELLEELIGANLTRNQAKVAFAVCRKTYGFNKKTDRIADSQICQLTKLPRQKVNKAKNDLIAMKVLIKDGLAIGPNKNLSEWEIPECHQESVNVTKTVTKSVTKTVTEVSPKQGHTKDTNTKDKKDNINKPPIVPQESNPKPKAKPKASLDAASAEIPEWLSRDTWLSWVSYRKEIGKTIKSSQTITQAINVLTKSREIGYQPEEIINQSIASGWVGIFVPKQPKAPTKHVTKSAPENFSGKDYGQTDIPAWAEQP
ncbi:replication protein [Obesumbacterium proteus]|uniref:replication protein n=2 Tax=Obesumbacterium proteus TaxID=82983 RepID=UPI001F43AB47|nr:replication protein [Obesumbacterium proteus]MCE9886202.1 replication protein [Obesumbacterium proteus]MCE9914874.1 replication protein [Obesumbacterium proteus]MCE9931599.1 replication protein [Obesumbacterium proteus]